MNLELDCPNGGHFYVCQGNTTQFLGCCTEDPCADGTGDCPQAALRNASYSSADYDSIPEQACVASSLWYTCAATNPPFMGCCEANPCQDGGCFGANLTAARLSDNVTDASPFMTSEASSGGSRSALSTGAIVGIAVGSALAALGIGIVLFMLYQRREKKRQREQQQQQHGTPSQTWPVGTPTLYTQSPYQDSTAGFPNSQFLYGPGSPPYSSEKVVTHHQSSPSQAPFDQRPASVSPTWLSGTSSEHVHHTQHASISSIGSHGGLNALFSQSQRQLQQQQLSAVSEIDGAEMARPISELAGTSPQLGEEEHTYGAGYNRVSNRGIH